MKRSGPDHPEVQYDEIVRRFTATVALALPAGSTVAVVSKGDSRLLQLDGHRGWHFPRRDDGAYAGAYPQSGEEAVAQLERIREQGAQFLALPGTSAWWLDHELYAAFQSHLQGRYVAVASDRSTAVIYDLRKVHERAKAAVPPSPSGVTQQQAIEVVLASGIVNLAYYQEQIGQQFVDTAAAVEHYLRVGSLAGLNLHPLFDTRYYLRTYPSVAAAGWNPLVHYVFGGHREGCEPHPLFDSLWYAAQCRQSCDIDMPPLSHYLRTWRETSASPNPLLDGTFYADTACAPLEHYVWYGRRAGQYPSKLAKEMLEASRLGEPGGKPQVWVVMHDGGRTGAPLIGAGIVKHLSGTGHAECTAIFVRGGPLEDELRPFAKVLNLEPLLAHSERPSALRMLLDAARPSGVYGICNSVETRRVMDCFHQLAVPFISLIHEFPEYVPDGVLDIVHHQSARVVFPAKMVKDANAAKITGESGKLSVIPQGVFDPQFPRGDRNAAREAVRTELGLKPDALICLGCGSVDLRKGCDQFVSIAKAFSESHPEAKVVFVWVGELASVNSINSFQFWLMQDLKTAGLQDRVRFIGPRVSEALERCFLAADMFLMVSRQDPFPCVVLEAMAASLPVVCYDGRIGSTEILRDGVGLIVPFLDVRAAAEQVYSLCVDRDLRDRAGRRGRQLVVEQFQFDRYVTKLREMIPTVASALPDALQLTPLSRRPIRLPEATLATAMLAHIAVRQCDGFARPVVSIVVVTYNQLPFTQMCLSTVLANTEAPAYEIILIDNDSTDGTPEFLLQLSHLHPHVRVILNKSNRGFAAANNQGLALARGDVLVLLNNDTLVPPRWLSRLAEQLHDPAVGLVGPVTNRIGNEAEIKCTYQTYGQMLAFAQQRMQDEAGHVTDIPTLCMYCLAMRRETFLAIGPLDESFGVGLFEDDDYAMRARAAGYRVVCAEGCFVHHFGSASFGELCASGTYGPLFDRNRQRFEAKWNRPWKPHAVRPDAAYTAMIAQVRDRIREHTEPDAEVLVISKGDEELVSVPDRTVSHFPQAGDRSYAGFYPADSDAAIDHLRLLRADYLVIPANSAWWLDHYPAFGQQLRRNRVHCCGACEIFSLASVSQPTVEQR